MSYREKDGAYVDDGRVIDSYSLASYGRKLLSYRKIGILLNKLTPQGKRVPVDIRFVSTKGEIVEWKGVICTSRNAKARTHNYFSPVSMNHRTIRDILVLTINDVKLTVD